MSWSDSSISDWDESESATKREKNPFSKTGLSSLILGLASVEVLTLSNSYFVSYFGSFLTGGEKALLSLFGSATIGYLDEAFDSIRQAWFPSNSFSSLPRISASCSEISASWIQVSEVSVKPKLRAI